MRLGNSVPPSAPRQRGLVPRLRIVAVSVCGLSHASGGGSCILWDREQATMSAPRQQGVVLGYWPETEVHDCRPRVSRVG